MKKIIIFTLVFTLMLGTLGAFADYDIEYSTAKSNPTVNKIIRDASRKSSGLIYPPEQHPYVFVNEEYIAMLNSQRENPTYKDGFTWLESQANSKLPALPETGLLSQPISRQLEARAFWYALGHASKEHAQETVDYAIKYLTAPKTDKTYSIDIYKDFGTQGIQCGGLVYDWCYNAMSAAQRQELADCVKRLMYAKEQPCRPDNVATDWGDMVGKAVGQPIIYNSIAATALYDIYPEIYDAIMPKIQGGMAEAMRLHGASGALSDGSISYTREFYSYYVETLFARMGEPGIYGNQEKIGYKMLYSRLPYGGLFKQGDDFAQAQYQIGQYINRDETRSDLGFLAVNYENPYFRFQFAKENPSVGTLFQLLLTTTDVEAKLPDDLPLAFESGYPRSEIMARTSWQDGLDSPAVSAYMSINERRTGDHDHAHIGEFQLYYKGPLTMPGGHYDTWGGNHWRNYYTRSISANCVTVYDPGEVFIFGKTQAEANDGGQRMVSNPDGGFTMANLNKWFLSDENLRSVKEGSYIGPNKNTPAFSYIKGDITKAYTSKMSSYKRGMVFMDTFNETYPGAMIVFDKVVSSRASFDKKWLLQAVTEPQIEGNKITIVNTEEGANGKLVNRTLLPVDIEIKKVGGVGKYVVDGVEYPRESEATHKPSSTYLGGWRCEVSPAAENKEDLFLNAMYVTDADGNAPELPMNYEETDEFVGVSTLDRLVMFSKNGNFVENSFKINIKNNEYDKVLCLITDVMPGKWTVTGGSETFIVESAEGENCLTFEAVPGEYTFIPTIDSATVTEFVWEEAEKEKIGDFAIKVGTTYAYVKNPNILKDGLPYFAAEDFVEKHLGADAELIGNTFKVTYDSGKVVEFTAGDTRFTVTENGETTGGTLAAPPFIDDNGLFYLYYRGASNHMGFMGSYIERAKVLRVSITADSSAESKLNGVDESRVIWPVAITASSDDGNDPDNTIDRNLGTRWSSVVADNEWICFDLGEEMDISSVQIAFYNGDKRNWKFDIQISNDGKEFTNVITGGRSVGGTKDPETFPLPEGTKARYVRYLGHGEEVTKGFYNSLTQFIINR